MKVQAIRCPSCLDVVWSRHRHDWRPCGCFDDHRGVFVDGGRDYLRYGWSDIPPEVIEIEVDQAPRKKKEESEIADGHQTDPDW